MTAGRTAALSAEDQERLRYALQAAEVDPARGVFADDSLSRRVHGELSVVLGGGRALLLQVAHPLVAAGVAAHSDYRRNPLGRLWRTLDLMLTINFGDAAAAIGAVRTIERMHAHVHGRLGYAVGPFPRGTQFDANDPDLLFWVHATLVDTALLVYEMFVEALTPEQQETYYGESKLIARLFGIPEKTIPATLRDFRRYTAAMLGGEALAVSGASREIAASVLSPPLPVGLKQILQLPNLVTVGLLPAELRARYGYEWGPVREAALAVTVTAMQAGLACMPGRLRRWPRSHSAAPGRRDEAGGKRASRGKPVRGRRRGSAGTRANRP